MQMLRTLSLLLTFALTGCAQLAVATPEPVTLTLAGSTEMQPLLLDLSAEYTRRNPNVLFDIRGGGSSLAERWVADGRIDLAASTLVPDIDPSSETDAERIPIGLDALAVIVHATNPVENLTLVELRDLYNGRTLLWSEVGGSEEEILLVSREDGSGSRLLFEERVMAGESVALTAVVMPTSQDVVDFVAARPSAIGYASHSLLDTNPSSGSGGVEVRALRIEGVGPALGVEEPGRYHLSRPLYLVRRRGSGMTIRSFVDFVLSPAGQVIVGRRHGRIR